MKVIVPERCAENWDAMAIQTCLYCKVNDLVREIGRAHV